MFGTPLQPARSRGRGLAVEQFEDRITPVVRALPDTYTVAAGQVLTVSAANGLLANDFDDADTPVALTATRAGTLRYVNELGTNLSPSGNVFPGVGTAATLTLNLDGSFTFRAPSNIPLGASAIKFDYKAADANPNNTTNFATSTVTIRITTNAQKLYAVGSGSGQQAQVRVFDSSTGLEKYSFFPYDNFFNGVRVATGDVTGDGVDDIVTVPADGGGLRVQVYDGRDGVKLVDYFAVDPNFRGGGYVAVGDVFGTPATTGNLGGLGIKFNDIIVGAGPGGGPRITVYDGALVSSGSQTLAASPLLNFFAFDTSLRGGVQVAAGNLGGFGANDLDARDYIVAGAGDGGGPAIAVYDGRQVAQRTTSNPNSTITNPTPTAFPPPLARFFAFDPITTTGVNVAVGTFDSSGRADIVAGQAAGSPIVRVFDGRNFSQLRQFTVPTDDIPTGLTAPSPTTTTNTPFVGSTNFGSSGVASNGLVVPAFGGGQSGSGTGGVRVGTTDRNGDGLSDILTSFGPGLTPRVRIFDGNALTEVNNFLAFPTGFNGGVYVGGNSLQ
jgi:hypothetical protein